MNPAPRKPSNLPESLQHQLNAYALAASAAGVSLLALAQPAESKIVYTKTHRSISDIHLDVNHDGVVDFYVYSVYKHITGVYSRQDFAYGAKRLNGVIAKHYLYYAYASALPAGFRVGGGSKSFMRTGFMASKSNSTRGQWGNGGKGLKNRYLGLKFYIHGKVHYGWARCNMTMPNALGTLTGYAYETVPNKPIITGKTSGPGVVTLQDGALGQLARGAR